LLTVWVARRPGAHTPIPSVGGDRTLEACGLGEDRKHEAFCGLALERRAPGQDLRCLEKQLH